MRRRLAIAVMLVLGATSSARAAGNGLALSFHHAALSVSDLDREADWYARVLGFSRGRAQGDDRITVIHMTRPGLRIDLVRLRGSVPAPQGMPRQGWLHVVFTSPDLADAYARLRALQTDVHPEAGGNGPLGHLVLHDPEGNEIGIAQGD